MNAKESYDPPDSSIDRELAFLNEEAPFRGFLAEVQRVAATKAAVGRDPEAVRKIIGFCMANLRMADPQDPADHARVLLLAHLASRRDEVWRKDDLKRGEAVRHCLPRLALAEHIATALGHQLIHIIDDAGIREKVTRISDDFENAIAPRRLFKLVENNSLAARSGAYVRNRGRNRDAVEADAKSVFDAQLRGADAATRRRVPVLIGKLGADRLQTYSADGLVRIAGFFRDWDPLVRHLSSLTTGSCDGEFQRLSQQLEGQLGARWPHPPPDCDVADAVQSAFSHAADPHGGYAYECSLPAWLMAVATNRLLTADAENRRRLALKAGNLSTSADGGKQPACKTGSYELTLRAHQRTERYMLVETFFKGEARQRVKEMWQQMHSNTGQPSLPNDLPDDEQGQYDDDWDDDASGPDDDNAE